jgi:hypothetical protein
MLSPVSGQEVDICFCAEAFQTVTIVRPVAPDILAFQHAAVSSPEFSSAGSAPCFRGRREGIDY